MDNGTGPDKIKNTSRRANFVKKNYKQGYGPKTKSPSLEAFHQHTTMN